MEIDNKRIENYHEFWDFYVREHSEPLTRYLHFIGTSLGIILLVWFIVRGTWYYFPLCLIVGYAFAWISHFFVEHNKPATFKYPLWSFISDYKMVWFMITGKMDAELERARQDFSDKII
ncbi:MAG: DUF962 domain-containing protein [Acidobacteria bacterium]|jgi:hypothetical protein|nr:DUF962 domain-containing protein [Acidobacteriota bacterium]